MTCNEYALEYRPLEEILEKSSVYAFELTKQGKLFEMFIESCPHYELFNLKIKIWE